MSADLEAAYRDFDTDLRRFVGRRLADPAAVDDVLQETYLRIHRHADSLREPGRLQRWDIVISARTQARACSIA